MKTAWIIVKKATGRPRMSQMPDVGKLVTVFGSRKAARMFVDDDERIQRVRLTIY